MGLSHEALGIYCLLQALYWENDCVLLQTDKLVRKLGLRGKTKLALLYEVLDEFFPEGKHAALDACMEQAMKLSRKQSERAAKGHAKRRTEAQPAPYEYEEDSEDAEDDNSPSNTNSGDDMDDDCPDF